MKEGSYYSDLSKYELLDIFYVQRGALVDDVTIFMTILFSYIAASYLVGEKLDRAQVIVITGLYSAFALMNIFGVLQGSIALYDMAIVLDFDPSIVFFSSPIVILAVCWAFSIWFMVRVRKDGISHVV